MEKKTFPPDLLRVAQALDTTLYQIGKGDLEGTLAGKMISLWREASSPFFKELFESVLCLDTGAIHPDRFSFLRGKYGEDLSYGLASAVETEAEKVILASFRKGFGKAERDVGVSVVFGSPEHRVYPYVGFAKAAMGSFFGLRVVPTINYILKEFSLFQSGDNLDALCTVLQKDCVDPVLHWRKESSIHVKRAYHYGYVSGMQTMQIPLLVISSEEGCCPVCREMTGIAISTESLYSQYRKIAQSSFEDLLQIAPFPSKGSLSEWAGDLACAPFSTLPLHPFCTCTFRL